MSDARMTPSRPTCPCFCFMCLSLVLVVTVVVVISSAGCQSAKKRVGFATMEAVPSVGRSTAPSESEAVESDVRIDYIAARARGPLTQPKYPATVLAAGGRSHVVYATITFDETGRVTDVSRSFERVSFPNEFSDEFLEAIRDAVTRWDVAPAVQVYWQKVKGGEDRYHRTEFVSDKFKMKFTFEASGNAR